MHVQHPSTQRQHNIADLLGELRNIAGYRRAPVCLGAFPGPPAQHHPRLPDILHPRADVGATSGSNSQERRPGHLGREDRGVRPNHNVGPLAVGLHKALDFAAGRRSVRLREAVEHRQVPLNHA